MRTTAELEQAEIKDALRAFVEEKTGGKVMPNGIRISFSKAPNNGDPREQDEIRASVRYETA